MLSFMTEGCSSFTSVFPAEQPLPMRSSYMAHLKNLQHTLALVNEDQGELHYLHCIIEARKVHV